jgi:sigma-54 dependent transcriptional regulator, acetoin dehydrogenase operon transcriptional activator AcoR
MALREVRHADHVLRVAHGMTPDSPVILSESIGDSWKRCVRDYSLDPVRIYSPAVISTGDLRGRQVQHEQLIQIASAEMDSLYEQIRGSGYALLLTDASGVILCEKIDATLKGLFRSAGLLIGADWSELHEGTNGIGTCISVDRPVTVHRSEHFRASHIGLSCSGAPIHDPAGALLAVLDASTVDARGTRASQAHTMALVNMSAQLIEKCVFLQHHQNTRIVRFHARPELVNLLHDGSLALAPDGTVMAADEVAVRLLAAGGRSDLVGHPFDESSGGPSAKGAFQHSPRTPPPPPPPPAPGSLARTRCVPRAPLLCKPARRNVHCLRGVADHPAASGTSRENTR